MYLDEDTTMWVAESNVTLLPTGELFGYTYHFTVFAVAELAINRADLNQISSDDFAKFENIDKSSVGVCIPQKVRKLYRLFDMVTDFVAGLYFVYLILLAATIYIERKHLRDQKRKKFDSISTELGEIPPPLPTTTSDTDSVTSSNIVYKRRSVLIETSIEASRRIQRNHSWVAIFFSKPNDQLRKSERLTLLLCMVSFSLFKVNPYHGDAPF